MARKRESKRIGWVILLSLATAAALPFVVGKTVGSVHSFALLVMVSPLTFIAALVFWGLVLVGPYRPPGYASPVPRQEPETGPAPTAGAPAAMASMLPSSGRPTVTSRRSSRPL